MAEAKKVLVVGCHAVDWLWRAGGTLANYAKIGSEIKVIDLTVGARGESDAVWKANPGITEEEVIEIRKNEVRKAAKIIGVKEVEFMDFSDHYIVIGREEILRIALSIRKFNPDIILTHSRLDPRNPDHETAFRTALTAARFASTYGAFPDIPVAKSAEIFSYEPDIPEICDFCPDTFIDISDVYEQKCEAMNCVPSQPGEIVNYSMRNKMRGIIASRFKHDDKNFECVEAFQRVTPWVGKYFDFIY